MHFHKFKMTQLKSYDLSKLILFYLFLKERFLLFYESIFW